MIPILSPRRAAWHLRNWTLVAVSWALWKLSAPWRSTLDRPGRILVVKLDHLGDGILATAVLQSLRVAYPAAAIDLLCARWNRQAFETLPFVRYRMQFNPSHFASWHGVSADRGMRLWRSLWELRHRYDLIINLRGSWLTLLLAAHPHYVDVTALRAELSRHSESPFSLGHELERIFAALRKGGMDLETFRPLYPIPEAARKEACDLLDRLGVPPGARCVALHVGTPDPRKRWLPARWAHLAERLESAGYTVLLLGSNADAELNEEVSTLARSPTVDLSGKTSLPATAAVLERCVGFIGNDSGPMHLAAAVGTATLGLFFQSGSDVRRWHPLGPWAESLTAPTPRHLSVEEVYSAFMKLLERRGE